MMGRAAQLIDSMTNDNDNCATMRIRDAQPGFDKILLLTFYGGDLIKFAKLEHTKWWENN